MQILISLVMAIAPSLLLVCYFYNQDLKKPEPKGLVCKILFLGILIAIPTGFIELLLDELFSFLNAIPIIYNFIKAFIFAALLEEFLKCLLVIKLVYRNPHFDEVMDGIIYTIVASLGFACLENFIYVRDTDLTIALIRAFTAVPMHAMASGIMGYYIGKAKFCLLKKQKNSLIYKGLWCAILIHGIYDFVLFMWPHVNLRIALSFFLLLILTFILTFINLKEKIGVAIMEDKLAGRHLSGIGEC